MNLPRLSSSVGSTSASKLTSPGRTCRTSWYERITLSSVLTFGSRSRSPLERGGVHASCRTTRIARGRTPSPPPGHRRFRLAQEVLVQEDHPVDLSLCR